MLYFAYGSNLNLSQMQRRCPAATRLGKLMLPNTRLVFRGVADVVFEEGHTCPGGLWRITPECEHRLDLYEGFDPHYPDRGMYSKEYITVEGLPDGETEVMLYTMNSRGIFPPSDHYYSSIVQGYRDFGLKIAPLKAALKHSYDDKRPTHVERKRTRRMGRPALAPRPQPKPVAAVKPKQSKTERRKQKNAARKPVVYHDPWGVDAPAEMRNKKVMNLTDWLEMRRNGGHRY